MQRLVLKNLLMATLMIAAAAGMASGAASAQEQEGHLLNFQDADIRSLITTVADIT
ncbi:MAG: hypothetical protein GW900_01030, partial [Gammaproteobacteria bacterium]|nr:hypothetical protein [Gammaproteobacteria bacterium]